MPDIFLRLHRWIFNSDGTKFCSRSTAERGIHLGLLDVEQVGGATYVRTSHEEYLRRRMALKKNNPGELQHHRDAVEAGAKAARQRRAAQAAPQAGA